MFESCRTFVPHISGGDKDVLVVCVGDGVYPRCGAMFAMRTMWNVMSVDPKAVMLPQYERVNRLSIFPVPIQEFSFPVVDTVSYTAILVVCCHSHATAKQTMKPFYNSRCPVHYIVMPCCVPFTVVNTLGEYYRDSKVLSPKNEIFHFTQKAISRN